MIRVGVIGYGTIGKVHCEALQSVPGCKLTSVVDVDAAARDRAQRDFDVQVFQELDEMFSKTEVDLVDVCVPTHLHADVVVKAMEANKHIFCEKPLARSLDEGKRLVELSENYPQKIGVGHVVRFFPAYQGIRQIVEEGEIGKAGVVRTFRGGSQYPVGWQDWFADYDLSGGVILDLAIHDIDYCRWLFGDVQRVYAKTTKGRTDSRLEQAMIVLRFKSGVIAHVEGSWTNYPGEFYTTVEVSGTNGLISYDSRKTHPIMTVTGSEQAWQVGPVAADPYAFELQDMVEAILKDRSPLVSVQDAFGTLQVALAAVESARIGQVVHL